VLPEPQYTVPLLTDADLPAYLPCFARLPRGPFKALPQLPVAGFSLGDMTTHRLHPEDWMNYARRPVVLTTEQDYRQHEQEGWYGAWVRKARRAGQVWAATAVEFSNYADCGNFSHFWSIQRSFASANRARAEFCCIYANARLRIDDLSVAWLRRVPNFFQPFFPPQTEVEWRRLHRWVAAVGGWKKVRLLIAHCDIRKLASLPKEVRRATTWADMSLFSTCVVGGPRGNRELEKKSKVDLFKHLLAERQAFVTRTLRG
jgi:hypothetical protein